MLKILLDIVNISNTMYYQIINIYLECRKYWHSYNNVDISDTHAFEDNVKFYIMLEFSELL